MIFATLCCLYQIMVIWIGGASIHVLAVTTIPYLRRKVFANELCLNMENMKKLDAVTYYWDLYLLVQIRLKCHFSIFRYLPGKIIHKCDLSVKKKRKRKSLRSITCQN